MSETIIEIKNILCSYGKNNSILHVEKFHLNRSEIVFLLGPSGIGKSTLIEAMGLINNTALKEDNCSSMNFIDSDGKSIDLIEIWKMEKNELEKFRKGHFSFIFQNNFLMPNLTAGDNMMITLLMKGESELKAREKIIHYMKVVNLDEKIFDKPIYHLSGGQKQRLAFVRAIAAPLDILIGDEPTGNLDSHTAKKLMGYTRDSLIENKKCGLFVSHDINLALEYSDRIYILKPYVKGGRIVGLVDESSVIRKSNGIWMNGSIPLSDPFKFLSNTYTEIF